MKLAKKLAALPWMLYLLVYGISFLSWVFYYSHWLEDHLLTWQTLLGCIMGVIFGGSLTGLAVMLVIAAFAAAIEDRTGKKK